MRGRHGAHATRFAALVSPAGLLTLLPMHSVRWGHSAVAVNTGGAEVRSVAWSSLLPGKQGSCFLVVATPDSLLVYTAHMGASGKELDVTFKGVLPLSLPGGACAVQVILPHRVHHTSVPVVVCASNGTLQSAVLDGDAALPTSLTTMCDGVPGFSPVTSCVALPGFGCCLDAPATPAGGGLLQDTRLVITAGPDVLVAHLHCTVWHPRPEAEWGAVAAGWKGAGWEVAPLSAGAGAFLCAVRRVCDPEDHTVLQAAPLGGGHPLIPDCPPDSVLVGIASSQCRVQVWDVAPLLQCWAQGAPLPDQAWEVPARVIRLQVATRSLPRALLPLWSGGVLGVVTSGGARPGDAAPPRSALSLLLPALELGGKAWVGRQMAGGGQVLGMLRATAAWLPPLLQALPTALQVIAHRAMGSDGTVERAAGAVGPVPLLGHGLSTCSSPAPLLAVDSPLDPHLGCLPVLQALQDGMLACDGSPAACRGAMACALHGAVLCAGTAGVVQAALQDTQAIWIGHSHEDSALQPHTALVGALVSTAALFRLRAARCRLLWAAAARALLLAVTLEGGREEDGAARERAGSWLAQAASAPVLSPEELVASLSSASLLQEGTGSPVTPPAPAVWQALQGLGWAHPESAALPAAGAGGAGLWEVVGQLWCVRDGVGHCPLSLLPLPSTGAAELQLCGMSLQVHPATTAACAWVQAWEGGRGSAPPGADLPVAMLTGEQGV